MEMQLENILLSIFDKSLLFLANLGPKILAGIVLLIIIFYLKKFVDHIVIEILKKSKLVKSYKSLYLKLSKILYIFISLIAFFSVLGLKSIVAGIFAGGGITTIVLGFAFREIGENFIAGLLLTFSKPFEVGDVIESSGFSGTVEAIEVRSTLIKSFDGKFIYIPSSQIYKNALINYSKNGSRRFSFKINLDYSCDIEKACLLIEGELQKIKGILQDPGCDAIIDVLDPNFVKIDARFWVDLKGEKSGAALIKEASQKVKDALLKKKFILANERKISLNVKSN